MKVKDEPIAEIREIRHQISQEFDNDHKRYINYLKKSRDKYIDQIKLYEDMSLIKASSRPRSSAAEA